MFNHSISGNFWHDFISLVPFIWIAILIFFAAELALYLFRQRETIKKNISDHKKAIFLWFLGFFGSLAFMTVSALNQWLLGSIDFLIMLFYVYLLFILLKILFNQSSNNFKAEASRFLGLLNIFFVVTLFIDLLFGEIFYTPNLVFCIIFLPLLIMPLVLGINPDFYVDINGNGSVFLIILMFLFLSLIPILAGTLGFMSLKSEKRKTAIKGVIYSFLAFILNIMITGFYIYFGAGGTH